MIVFLYPRLSYAASIQERIDKAEAGERIELTGGTYTEELVIDRPIHLIGKSDTEIVGKGSHPTILIEADHVTIENIRIVHEDETKQSAGILIKGNKNTINDIHIKTNTYGIHLDGADKNKLVNINVSGQADMKMTERNHGIYIWESHDNQIQDALLEHVKDGIYIERSYGTRLVNNTTTRSRYGYHLMFTKNTVLEHNKAFDNVSGLYIMGDRETVVKHNLLKNNRENVQSMGLFVFDTSGAVIQENMIENNRIGIYVESARDNHFSHNDVRNNFIGLQFKEAQDNEFITNTFLANIVQGHAMNSSNNMTDGNYWSDHLGLDVTGNNLSDLPYKIDPLYIYITNEYPAFQLLFQSPGWQFIKNVIQAGEGLELVDHTPLIQSPSSLIDDKAGRDWTMIAISFSLLLLSTYIIYLGVKIHEKV